MVEGFQNYAQGICKPQRGKLTHFVLAAFWQSPVQLSTWFNHSILASLGPLAPSRLDTEIGMIQRLKSL